MDEIVFYIILLVIAGIVSSVSNKNKQEQEKKALEQRKRAQQEAATGPLLKTDVPRQQSRPATKTDAPQGRPAQSRTACPRCALPNPAGKTFCIRCGQRLAAPAKKAAPTLLFEEEKSVAPPAPKKTAIEKQVQERQEHQKPVIKRKPLSERKEYVSPSEEAKKPLKPVLPQKTALRARPSEASHTIKAMLLSNPEQLQQAFIVKEILDKPLALRRR